MSGGWYKGIYFRSGWEISYAKHLDLLVMAGEIKSWRFEPERFLWQGGSYLPDFEVTLPNGKVEYHEVKGKVQGIQKLRRFVSTFKYPTVLICNPDSSIKKYIKNGIFWVKDGNHKIEVQVKDIRSICGNTNQRRKTRGR